MLFVAVCVWVGVNVVENVKCIIWPLIVNVMDFV